MVFAIIDIMPKWTEQQQMELLGSGSGSGSSNSTTPPRGHGGSNRSLVNRSTRSDTHASTTTTSNNPCRTTDHLNRFRIYRVFSVMHLT